MPNRLATESSPYLLQHAENPVAWYPWGQEALSLARDTDRPILLSIGYSSCHWCHVMERESFEDPEVAELMNRSFVNIKVDREERPDVDQIYMRAVQAMTGHGGWPLTVFLTPQGVPYYGGTYFPPTPRQGMPSFRQVLDAAAQAFQHRRSDVEKGASDIATALTKAASAAGADPDAPGEAVLDAAVRSLSRMFDPAHGGFGRAPKFPQPATLEILFRHHARTGGGEALQMALTTLRRMASGGIRDHLGGGFHRYSVDARWLVPHFEKMLYDNALLAQAYLDAYRITGQAWLKDVATDTLDHLLDDMRDPDGGFYSARDADSEGEEGLFYVWTVDQVMDVLGPDEGRLFCRVYDVTEGGNFEGRNILWLPHDPEMVARALDLDPAALEERLAAGRRALLEVRARRVAPFRDEKVLTAWNGLVLRALAEAGGALGDERYLQEARSTAGFLLRALRQDDVLLRTYKDGEARIPGFLEDYASLGNALLSLHEATLEARWLTEARWCCQAMVHRFRDDDGLFHDTAHDAEALFMRPRDPMDNATPSGNSLAAELLARVGHLTGDEGLTEMARRVVARERQAMESYPTAFGRLLSVVDRLVAPPVEVAVVGPADDPGTREMVRTALAPFHRNRVITGADPDAGQAPDLPLLEGKGALGDGATAYLCQGYACQAPVTDAASLARQWSEVAGGHPPAG